MNITDKAVRGLKAPAEGQMLTWDEEIKGFGVRVTTAGAVSFILDYRVHTRQRRFTIGRYPEWSAQAARDEAIELRKKVRNGVDPMGERRAFRNEPTFGDLLDDYLDSDELRKKRMATQSEYRRYAESFIRPVWGRMRLKAVQRRDVEALHGQMKATPYQANRVISFVSRLFNYAIEGKMTEKNPAQNIEHYHEARRERYLNQEDSGEIARFTAALDGYRDQNAANALRLALLTGARIGEVLKAEWSQFNVQRGTWTKPSAHTKQKKTEHVPLSPPTLELLAKMKPHNATGPLFLGRAGKDGKRKARVGIRRPWLQACKAAGLVEIYEVASKRKGKDGKPKMLKRYRPTVRTHDLRHTFASHLASNHVSLQIIGKLIGHTQASTTMRYAHLQNESLREATGQFGKIFDIEKKRRSA
jgi:integrase